MAHCEHRQPNDICTLLERGGADKEGYTKRCPTRELCGSECSLVIRLGRWTEDELRHRQGESTPAERKRAEDEVLPEVVLDFCEHEL